MPFLCCCADSTTNNTEDAVATTTTKRSPQKGSARRTTTPNNESAEERKERELAESVYHDAKQSMTASMMMSTIMQYPPATTSMAQRRFSLDSKPQDLLLLSVQDENDKGSSHRRQQQEDKNNKTPLQNSSVIVRQELQADKTTTDEITTSTTTQPGYPGNLTQSELEACLEFRKLIKEKKVNDDESSHYNMVRVYDGYEPEAFALCRFMRARKFVVPGILGLMAGNFEAWNKGQSNNFYPNSNLQQIMGCPTSLSVLQTQLPIIQHGLAKNGSMVSYFKVGGVSLEALDCIMTDLENLVPYFWNLFTHGFMAAAGKAQSDNPTITILFEVTMIIDLKGINRSLFSEKVLTVLKDVIKVFNCFPEVLSKLIFTNAPFFFSAIWMMLKGFLDPRTVQKVSIFASPSKGQVCMAEHVDPHVLLSDYGGTGPSYETVLQAQAISKEEDHTKIARQFVERIFLDSHGKQSTTTKCKFDLNPNETASVVVITKSTTTSTGKAIFTVSSSSNKNNKDGGKEQITVNGGSNVGQPYSQEIASELKGPGHFAVTAKSDSRKREYFLVVVTVR